MSTLLSCYPKLAIAPMMGCTDRHFRYLMRLISRHTLLVTEMVTTQAILFGDRAKLLKFHPIEHPVAAQLGGSDPSVLAACARIVEQFGYDEINLNVGCPSTRVQAGQFGACLMKVPSVVADCVQAMQRTVTIPVTVKTRIGVDDCDSYSDLCEFIQRVHDAGCNLFIIHARKAWLNGLSPRENRMLPPLQYEIVYQLKRDFPHLQFVLNGGVTSLESALRHLQFVEGVMIGRAAYSNPALLLEADQLIFGSVAIKKSCLTVVQEYIPYVAEQLQHGERLRNCVRHLIGLFCGEPGARSWRRHLSLHAVNDAAGVAVIEQALQILSTSSCRA